MQKKNGVAAILFALSLAGTAQAAPVVSSKTLQLNWAGTVPVSPSSTGDWKFVDILDNTRDFVPQTGSIIVNPDPSNPQGKVIAFTPMQFALKTAVGAMFTDTSDITAYLVTDVTFQGLTPTSSTAARPTMVLSSGATQLGVGAANAVRVASVAGTSTGIIPITLTGTGTLPSDSYSEGNNFTSQAIVMFTASVGV